MKQQTNMHLNAWFQRNYNSLKTKLEDRGLFDSDIFHGTYLQLSESINGDMNNLDLEEAFLKKYSELSKSNYWEKFKTVNGSDTFFELTTEENTDQSPESIDPKVFARIKQTAEAVLTSEEYIIFHLRYELNMSLSAIGAYMGVSKDIMRRSVGNITSILKKYHAKYF